MTRLALVALGRWWTKSLNTDKWNFITYMGSAYPMLALARYG
jgi:squalene-hopene/tetraprenyl-beta-curcumene cyclase